jgi:hypothetical protein
MATETSDQVMALLQELSILKKADTDLKEQPTQPEREEHNLREKRKQEIVEEIKALAEQKKDDEQTSADADLQKQGSQPKEDDAFSPQ